MIMSNSLHSGVQLICPADSQTQIMYVAVCHEPAEVNCRLFPALSYSNPVSIETKRQLQQAPASGCPTSRDFLMKINIFKASPPLWFHVHCSAACGQKWYCIRLTYASSLNTFDKRLSKGKKEYRDVFNLCFGKRFKLSPW